MSVGMILLTASAILVFSGAAQRVLDKLYLSDRMALFLIALMFFGSLLPLVTLGSISISIGGAVIPAGICVYVLFRSGSAKERLRGVIGSLLTGGAIYAISALMPDEPEAIVIDPVYMCGLTGGLVAYLLGRSRRNAFVCGVFGVLLADIAVAIVNWTSGIQQQLILGGAGVFDTVIISGLLGVVLSELIGELIERLAGGGERIAHPGIQNPIRRKER